MMRLALSLGMTLRQLQENMSAGEFALWVAYFNESPPEHDADHRAAMICSSIWQSQGAKKARLEMFMPQRRRKTREDVWREQIAVMRSFNNGGDGGNGNSSP